MAAATKPGDGPTLGTWSLRAVLAIAAGLAIGGFVGVAGVRRVEPGHPGQADSLQTMLDSLRRNEAADPRTQRRAADSTDAAQRARRFVDSVALANDATAPIVPAVINMEEGAARNAIEQLGLVVGSVQFKASTSAAGTVLTTVPIAGQKVRLGTAINLVLSDGRSPSDTTDTLAAFSAAHPASPRVP